MFVPGFEVGQRCLCLRTRCVVFAVVLSSLAIDVSLVQTILPELKSETGCCTFCKERTGNWVDGA